MNVLMFSDTYPPFINGVSTSVFNLVKTLKEHGDKVLLITPRYNQGDMEYKDGVIYLPGVELKWLYGYRFPRPFDQKVMAYIKEFKPDVIHYHTDSTLGIFARRVARRIKKPLIYTYHTNYEDYTYYVTRGFADRAAKRIVRLYSKTIAKNTTEFITPSDKTKDFFRSTKNDLFINVIPTGIDFSNFIKKPEEEEKETLFRIEHHIDKDTKIFLVLGRLAKEKSMDQSIRGYAAFRKAHPEIKSKMIIVGGGPARSELELLVHELGIPEYVDFIGPVSAEEVPFYYHISDIYTSASVTETQGLTYMEAMASHTIVLARLDDNLSGTIIDGRTGFFFTDEANFVEKATKILYLTDIERNNILKQSDEIISKYSIETFYTRIKEVYNRAIRKCW